MWWRTERENIYCFRCVDLSCIFITLNIRLCFTVYRLIITFSQWFCWFTQHAWAWVIYFFSSYLVLYACTLDVRTWKVTWTLISFTQLDNFILKFDTFCPEKMTNPRNMIRSESQQPRLSGIWSNDFKRESFRWKPKIRAISIEQNWHDAISCFTLNCYFRINLKSW